MTVLVTGGAGFMGRHLVALLVAQGRNVRSLDTAPWPGAPCEHLQASILDAAALAVAFAGVTHVAHLAANSSLWARNPAIFARVNVEGARAVSAAAARAGVARFVHVSSATTLVGGPRADALLTEASAPPDLLGAYPRAKRAGEAAVLATPGLDAVALLPTLPAGPGDVSRTAPTRLLADLARGGPPAILETWMDFVDVRDLAQTIAAALAFGTPGARYIVGGRGLWLSELALAVDRLAGRTPRPRPKVPYAVALAAALASEAAAKVSGREPQASLTGVRLAGRIRRFDSSAAAADLGHRARPLDQTLADALPDLA